MKFGITIILATTLSFFSFLQFQGLIVTDSLVFDSSKIIAGDYYRIISSLFIHSTSSLFHIVFNICFLLGLGLFMERYFSNFKIFCILFLSGISSNLAILSLSHYGLLGSEIRMLGFSGALCGLFSFFASYFPRSKIILALVPLSAKNAVLFVISINIFLGISGNSLFAWHVHLAGLFAGFLYANGLLSPLQILNRIQYHINQLLALRSLNLN